MEFLLTWQWWAATLAGAFIGTAIVLGPLLWLDSRRRR